jgi:hypothetical protein
MFIVDLFKSRRWLEAENLFLRHQLGITALASGVLGLGIGKGGRAAKDRSGPACYAHWKPAGNRCRPEVVLAMNLQQRYQSTD